MALGLPGWIQECSWSPVICSTWHWRGSPWLGDSPRGMAVQAAPSSQLGFLEGITQFCSRSGCPNLSITFLGAASTP